jgi:hypothetical protein
MAKCYKITMYVLDLNGSPSSEEELKSIIECNKYPEFKHVEKIEVANIGEWDDDHELNKRGADYEKYFIEEKYGEIRK